MTTGQEVVYGVIGGSGLYDFPELKVIKIWEIMELGTPFGWPSSPIVEGEIHGKKVFFLARHGRGHIYSPSEVPYRANIYALKRLGVTRLLSVSAVGSLCLDISPGDLIVPVQIIDQTRGIRPGTFFEGGIVAHVSMADPYCQELHGRLFSAVCEATDTYRQRLCTLVCIEGPQFSTRAESELYRSWGAHLIGMTAQPEAKLAREAGLCYATLALVTDYDCWYRGHDDVTVEMVVKQMKKNAETARAVLSNFFAGADSEFSCGCGSSVAQAIATDFSAFSGSEPPAVVGARARLDCICGEYLPKPK